MWELTKIVIPKIKAHWKDLAYVMRYDIADVDGINGDGGDLKERCEMLLTNWLKTDHGPNPKTYQILLQCIKKIDLIAASEEIERELVKGTYGQMNNTYKQE